jgi:hypothetical protein
MRSTALLIPSPWSGDERDPIPRSYHLWIRLYRTVRKVRHAVGMHDWRPWGPQMNHRRCDWCGASR